MSKPRVIGKAFLDEHVVRSWDEFSPCRTWRYRLAFDFAAAGEAAGRLAFIGLNPSTAEAWTLDPTVFKVARLARRLGCGGLDVFNAFGLVSTDPAGLKEVADPVGPGNDTALATIGDQDTVLAAWGVHAGLGDRFVRLRELLPERVVCLGVTKAGFPRHPLYVPESVEPTPYEWRE